ncbi:MAG TPA: lipocalin family protein [Longimicrobium sp.]|jgi:hypothetical protein|uniref:lipocalin family protein n=1 Tax=Longimicrobium sp. TaxID=2029185 RepID=UPI002ED7973B
MRTPTLIVPVICMLVAACSDVTSSDSITGTYTLRTVNGDVVPAVIYDSDSGTEEVLDGSVRLDEDGSGSIIIRVRSTLGGGAPETETRTANGTYTRSGSTITITFLDEGETVTQVGQLQGETLMFMDDLGGDVYVFRK